MFDIEKLAKLFKKETISPAPSSPAGGEEEDSIAREHKNPSALNGRVKQIFNLLLFSAGVLVAIFVMLRIAADRNKGERLEKAKESSGEKVKIEVASKALDPEKMWRNHFEDKLKNTNEQTSEKLRSIEESMLGREKASREVLELERKQELERLNYLREELTDSLREVREIKDTLLAQSENKIEDRGNVSFPDLRTLPGREAIAPPQSSRNYIPATSYVSGVLLGGINVSTSLGSASEPVPLVIRITGRGNLPKNFIAKLTDCRILASAYGDLSSERAVIRAEALVCENKGREELVTTDIAGAVYGDDGASGIKGKIVETSSRQVRNAMLGGLLSGMSNTAKVGDRFQLSGLGAISTTKKNFKERLGDNSLNSLGNAGEKIADYYMRRAEAMSPVLQIPGGTKLDVVFTKGVIYGSVGVDKKIAAERKAAAGSGNNYSGDSFGNFGGEE